MPSRRRAFTLVELLVVVGIIAVVISILMPALGKAREQANRAKCGANLHVMGQALVLYTHQYGYYPGCFSLEGAVWPMRLRALLGGERRVFNCPSQDDRFHWTEAGTGGDSPRANPFQAALLGYDVGDPVVTTGSYFTYGYNMWGTGDGRDFPRRGLGALFVSDPDPRYENRGLIRMKRVKVPSEMIAITDSTVDGIWDCAIDAPNDPVNGIGFPRGFPGRIHNGGANVLFCDGHVQWYLQRELVPQTGAAETARRRLWNSDHEP